MHGSRRSIELGIGMLLAIGGCWRHDDPQPQLGTSSFYRPVASEPSRSVDNTGAIFPRDSGPVSTDEPIPPTAQTVTEISPAVKDVVRAEPPPATAPTATIGSGQYVTLGAVVTQVSGTPIYADKVLQALSLELSTEAKQRTLDSYRALARREIEKQVNVMIRNELEYAAAMQNLSPEDKTLADNLTMVWRQRQVTEAGGSIELARRRAAAEGIDFDEKVREQHRVFLAQIFYQKKVFPQVQVSAADMRQYYDQHVKTEFTDIASAQFRLIRIDADKSGGRDRAIDKIKDLHDKAARGEDFADLAKSINDDANLMRNAGRVGGTDGWVQRGAFAIPKVEDSVWQLQVGQVSDVIDVGNSFYLAKLENRTTGRVHSFEEASVQNKIAEKLRREQVAAKREQVQNKLMKDAVISPYPPLLDTVIDMAIEKYPQWAAAGSARK